MENRKKVICIKKCLSSTYAIANVGDVFYINIPTDNGLSKLEMLYGIKFPTIYSSKPEPLYPKYNLSIVNEYNSSMNQGDFDARNFIHPAEYRDSRIDEIFADDCVESKICKLLN